MSGESIPSSEQDNLGTVFPHGYELFRAVREGMINAMQLPPIDSSPAQEQRDSDELDKRYGQVCADCGYTSCNCLTRGR